MKKNLWLGILLGFILLKISPAGLPAQIQDSTYSLSLDTVLNMVIEHHPVAMQAGLLSRQADVGIRAARGGFDPKLYAEWQQKSFKGSDYFMFGAAGLKIPTWFGLELKGSFQVARGEYLNPENNLPAAGQAVIGLKASALRGMIIDERRAIWQKARLLSGLKAAERQHILNDLLFEAASSYIEWWASYRKVEVFRRVRDITLARQAAVVASFEQGDKPAIDTLESFVQVQNRNFDLQEKELEFRNMGLKLANFLWKDGEIPLELQNNTEPANLSTRPSLDPSDDVLMVMQRLDTLHPALQISRLKIADIEISRRLAAEQLKPRLDLEFNFLGSGFDFIYSPGKDGLFRNLISENYKAGISFEMPLFFRKEKSNLALMDLKLLEENYELRRKRRDIGNKILAYYNEWQTTLDQLELYEQALTNYRRLLEAETQKFQLGESSIFLINSRENKLIEAELKLIKLQADLHKLRIAVKWAGGNMLD